MIMMMMVTMTMRLMVMASSPMSGLMTSMATRQAMLPTTGTAVGTRNSGRKLMRLRFCSITKTRLMEK